MDRYPFAARPAAAAVQLIAFVLLSPIALAQDIEHLPRVPIPLRPDEGALDRIGQRIEARIDEAGKRFLDGAEARLERHIDIARASFGTGLAAGILAGLLAAGLYRRLAMKTTAALLLLTLAVPLAHAQRRPNVVCGPNGCSLVPAPSLAISAPAAPMTWQTGEDPDELYLYQSGRQIGNYRPSTGQYFPLLDHGAGRFGAPVRVPIAPPPPKIPKAMPTKCACTEGNPCPCPVCKCSPVIEQAIGAEPVENHGVDLSKLGQHKQYRMCRGKNSACEPVTEAEAYEAITSGLPDDARKVRLTLIGTPEARARAEKDLAELPELADLREKCLIWSASPDDWHIQGAGFRLPEPGRCMVYAQAAAEPGAKGAKVLYRDEYAGPQDFQAIRQKLPDYDPKKDPGRSTPGSVNQIPPAAIGLGVLAVLVLASLRKAPHQ